MSGRFLRLWPVLALAGLIAFPWVYRASYYQLIGFNVLLFATMATSWNILGGFTGYKSLGHAAFYGLGGYLVALAHIHWGWNPFWSAPIMGLVVMVIAIPLGWIMLRTTGSAFVIVTIAMLLIFRIIAGEWRSVTRGSRGLSQPLPPYSPEYSRMPFYYYMLLMLVLAVAGAAFIRRSRFGLGLLAIADDEGKAEMVGVKTNLYKVIAFALSTFFIGVGGGIWSYNQVFIAPVFAFDIIIGVDMIIMTILGGLGTVWGPVLGAFILIPVEQWTINRFGSTPFHLAVRGGVMLGVLIFLPRGLLPTVSGWLRKRRGSAFTGARSMEEIAESEGMQLPGAGSFAGSGP